MPWFRRISVHHADYLGCIGDVKVEREECGLHLEDRMKVIHKPREALARSHYRIPYLPIEEIVLTAGNNTAIITPIQTVVLHRINDRNAL